MKAVYGLLMAFLATICLNAQNKENVEFPTDSLMKEIVTILNANEFNFWLRGTSEEGGPIPYRKILEKISYNSDSLCFITDGGRISFSLFQRIPKWKENQHIIIGGDYIIDKKAKYASGSKKSIAYAKEMDKQMARLYELLLPFEKKTYENQIAKITNENAKNLEDFQKVVDDYNNMAVKPVMTEEQRKYIVQANALTEEKKYYEAIEAYDKAMKINPVTYPPAYYNMALLSAQRTGFTYAILYMKKYLMLAPDADDARAAQDKIYEWELKK